MARPTIADLARAAGVGISTVDRVLNGRDPVRRRDRRARPGGRRADRLPRDRRHPAAAAAADRPERTLGFVLQQRSMPFYALLGEALAEATKASPADPRPPQDRLPGRISRPTRWPTGCSTVGKEADAVAVVSADHPRVTQAIDQLRAARRAGVRADLRSERAGAGGLCRAGQLEGRPDRRLGGRQPVQAPRAMSAIFVGSHRYRCQETCEMGFRSYFREHAPDFQPARAADEPRGRALRLREHARPAAAGPRPGGPLRRRRRGRGRDPGLREEGRLRARVTVGLDLTDVTRSGLIDGVLKLVLSHPLSAWPRRVVERDGAGHRARALRPGSPSPAAVRHSHARERVTAAVRRSRPTRRPDPQSGRSSQPSARPRCRP